MSHCVPKTDINTGITPHRSDQVYYICVFYLFLILIHFNLAFQTNFSLSYFSDGVLLSFLPLINVDLGFLSLLYCDCWNLLGEMYCMYIKMLLDGHQSFVGTIFNGMAPRGPRSLLSI